MSVPEKSADRRKPKRRSVGPFGGSALKYRTNGFLGTLPLPRGQKSPPPAGFTGGGRPHPTTEQVAESNKEQARGNIALRLADVPFEFLDGRDDLPPIYAGNVVDGWELVGIDVDNYSKGDRAPKRGAAELRALENELGELPATALSGARLQTGSCIAVYLVPKGYRFAGKAADAIEVIQKRHRYMVVHPSTNPDAKGADGQPARYAWCWGAPSKLAEAGPGAMGRFDGGLPSLADVAILPERWFDHLTHGGQAETDDPISGLTDSQLWQWLEGRPGYDGEMCAAMRSAVDELVAEIEASTSSHDVLTKAQWRLLNLAAEGHAGIRAALDEVGQAGFPAALSKRDGETLSAEMGRSIAGALDKIQPRWRMANGEDYAPSDTCTVDVARFDCEAWAARFLPADEPASEYKVFRVLGPDEWAGPVADPEFLISRVLCRDTFGVNAGPKKSLKTHDNQAIAFAVATGQNLYLSEHFRVPREARALYIVGEGGRDPIQRTLHRMGRAYGLDMTDVRNDPDFPLVVSFGAAPIDSPELRDDLKRMLDRYQPDLVLIESFYNFHPADINAGNLFERGQLIDNFHRFVREQCAGATSLMTDHYRSTASGKSLDLDNISMAGQAENADSWITRYHRKTANVPEGKFWLQTGFGSRQWGGTEWQIDWNLGPFNHDVGHHVGEITWEVRSAVQKAADATALADAETSEGRQRLILAFVDENPEMSKSAAIAVLGKRHGGDKKWRAEWEELISERALVQREEKVTRKHGDGTRQVTAKVWKRGDLRVGKLDGGQTDEA